MTDRLCPRYRHKAVRAWLKYHSPEDGVSAFKTGFGAGWKAYKKFGGKQPTEKIEGELENLLMSRLSRAKNRQKEMNKLIESKLANIKRKNRFTSMLIKKLKDKYGCDAYMDLVDETAKGLTEQLKKEIEEEAKNYGNSV